MQRAGYREEIADLMHLHAGPLWIQEQTGISGRRPKSAYWLTHNLGVTSSIAGPFGHEYPDDATQHAGRARCRACPRRAERRCRSMAAGRHIELSRARRLALHGEVAMNARPKTITAESALPGEIAPIPKCGQQIVLVLQGGGALGSYQAGVYQALHEAGIEPDWIIGTSIGAINA